MFNLRDLTEAEGVVLRTLINMSDDKIKRTLESDELYWSHEIKNITDAVWIGCGLRDDIFKAVDLGECKK